LSSNSVPEGVKDGILLEVDFDTVAPNRQCNISSWAYERAAAAGIDKLAGNRAMSVACYEPGYTLVEKLQTISTKYRKHRKTAACPRTSCDTTIMSTACWGTSRSRSSSGRQLISSFPAAEDKDIAKNEAFVLSDEAVRATYASAYAETSALYYQGQPPFADLLARIKEYAPTLQNKQLQRSSSCSCRPRSFRVEVESDAAISLPITSAAARNGVSARCAYL
jgi:hypothetical protein